ncbi:MAG: 23S rRNA (guanosine(2251)-2'-O)-methyltransferase RlmB [Spirochaetaceae bacterium]|nr:23S rRNA (guanosine(2251)-2'-O)-methyltransferase RlmB [Spirochaetaceae bacterium]MBQ4554033.1 23S rRNA (guanosine(2251)-2'-O)-methyltransferase RlmB [Spirochaetaceae bacterium]
MKIYTGFHSVEEKIRSSQNKKETGLKILYAKPGPRVKKIISQAKTQGIPCSETTEKELNSLVSNLSETAKEHRGIVLISENEKQISENKVDFDQFLKSIENKDSSIVVILDSITDPHNVGAIIRSCDQFGVDLVVLPERRGASESEIIGRSSAGASAWVQTSVVSNLVRTVEKLKEAGFWIYGADAGGETAGQTSLQGKIALVMGSEGSGISRLLEEKCDKIISIPTCGKLDSLNVSVACGVLLYEIKRQSMQQN